MPKAATKNQASTDRDPKNGKVTATESQTNQHGFTDFVEVEQAKAEYDKRKKTQFALIKKTDKGLLRSMLYEMVLGRIFEEKSNKEIAEEMDRLAVGRGAERKLKLNSDHVDRGEIWMCLMKMRRGDG